MPESAFAQNQAQQAEQLKLQQLLNQATQQLKQGQNEQAIATFQQVLVIARRNSFKEIEAKILFGMGSLYQRMERSQKALEYYNQALPVFREVKDQEKEAITLNNIAGIYYDIGQPKKVLEYYNQALPILRGIKNRRREAITLNNIGAFYGSIGQPQKALEYYNQALSVRKEVKDRGGEATTLSNIGEVYRTIGQPQKALDYFNQALPITKEVKDRGGEATTLNNIGVTYDTIGQPQKALEYFNQALPILKEVQNRLGESLILNNIGEVYRTIGQPQKALEYYNRALPISKEIKNRDGEATILNNFGLVYRTIDQPQKALEYFNQALPILREVQNRANEAKTLNNIGEVYRSIGQPQKALGYYNQALPIQKEVKDRDGEAATFNNIGEVYRSIGQPQKASGYYNQALLLFKEVQNRRGEAITLNNIGLVYSAIGQPQKALEYYNQALPIKKEVKDRSGEAITLNNIAGIYYTIGQPQKALEYYNQALPILRTVQNREEVSKTLSNIGLIYGTIGQPQKALEYYNQALPISKEINDRNGEATKLNNIGVVYRTINQPRRALEYYNQALPILREVQNRSGEAVILNNIGMVYDTIGQPRRALEHYTQSLTMAREVKDRYEEANTLSNLAYLERSRGNLKAALTHIETAIKIIETIRTEIISQEFRTTYFASQQDYYDLYINVLMRLHKQQPLKGFNTRALQASERARARGLLDLLKESRADIRQGVNPKLLEQEKNLQFQLNALDKRRIELYNRAPTKPQVANFEREYNVVLSQYQDIETQIRSNSPRYAALTQPKSITLAEIQQQVLDNNTVLLEYFVGKDRSYLWVVTKTSITSYELPKQTEIETASKKFRTVVSNPKAQQAEITQAGQPLTQMLLGSVASQLGQKRLLIVSNEALQYIPFAALPSLKDSQPLLANHEIINLPSASTLATLRQELNGRKPAAKSLAVFADPVFNLEDDRLSKAQKSSSNQNNQPQNIIPLPSSVPSLSNVARDAGVAFGRLKGTRKEAEDILNLLPANTRTQAFGFDANRTNVLNSDLSKYRIIHFATHGVIDTTRPALSSVVLSLVDQQGRPQNGFLRLNDIFNLKLPAELVVLSACQTALGQNVRGEGLIGLTRGFMYAGAPRVLVSLWSVNDESTAVLMKNFYQAMLEQNLPPAAALRAAQLKMMQTKWNSSYYWAAFTLQGEWR